MSEVDKGKGRAKKAAGELTGNKRVKREGQADKASGGLKGGINKLRGALTGKRR